MIHRMRAHIVLRDHGGFWRLSVRIPGSRLAQFLTLLRGLERAGAMMSLTDESRAWEVRLRRDLSSSFFRSGDLTKVELSGQAIDVALNDLDFSNITYF